MGYILAIRRRHDGCNLRAKHFIAEMLINCIARTCRESSGTITYGDTPLKEYWTVSGLQINSAALEATISMTL